MNPRFSILLAAGWLGIAAQSQAADATAVPDAALPQAVLQLEQRLGENPFDAIALNNLAVTKARAGDLYEAMKLLERAARLAPDALAIEQNRDALQAWLDRRARAQGSIALDAPSYSPMPAPPPIW